MKDTSNALLYYRKAIAIGEEILCENHPDIGMLYNNIGSIYDDKGELDLAMEHYKKALEIVSKAYGDVHPRIATILNNFEF